MKGAEAIILGLEEEGVEVIFGYPGGAILPFYDELYDSNIRHILVRHEQGAAHAADGYARATGKTGVCVSTSGPGATNLVTGIANAYMDSIPLVALTGQVPSFMIGNDSFQEINITGIVLPITKHCYLVKDADELPKIIKEAFYIASTGRKGPVLIDLPRDVQLKEINGKPPKKVSIRGYKPTIKGHPRQIRRACEMILEAERPVIYAGGGVIASGANDELISLAEFINSPVTTTLMGIGAFPQNHPLSLGMLGMHGTKYANYAISEADLIIAIGVRFDDRVVTDPQSFAPTANIIHIDIDPAEIGKIIKPDIPIVGDAKHVLSEMLSILRERKIKNNAWLEKIARWKKEYPLEYDESGGLKPQYIVQQIYDLCPDAIVVTEVGQNQMWAAQYFVHKKPRHFISSGGLGTMGYGLPASIGAKVGRPDEIVIDISGDGSFMMNCQEIATAVENHIPIKVMILNNRYLGMVRQWQELFYGRRYSYTDLESKTDFPKLAEAFGAHGILVTKKEEVRPAIKEALSIDEPVVVDFRIEREENVFPMVAPGKPITEIIDVRPVKEKLGVKV
ncbi:MAG: biosynthetic-type acetolactate synthase large subunit [Candidatus Syntropharchaeia archaeon]